jgi:hypothetical protein
MNAQVLAALGLPEDADAASMLSAIGELKASVEATRGFTPGDVERLGEFMRPPINYAQRVREIQAEEARRLHEEARERLLAVAVAEGRIRDDEAPVVRILYNLDPDAGKATLTAVPGPDGTRDLAEIINHAGEVVAARDDPDWLDRRATHLLAERGVTEPTKEEYAEALDAAFRASGRDGP